MTTQLLFYMGWGFLMQNNANLTLFPIAMQDSKSHLMKNFLNFVPFQRGVTYIAKKRQESGSFLDLRMKFYRIYFQ